MSGAQYADDTYGHGTAVAGIIASTDSTYKGIVYGIDKFVVCKVFDGHNPATETGVWDAVDWTMDASRAPFAYQHQTAEVINFSEGFDKDHPVPKTHGANDAYYYDSARFFDAVVDDLHVMVVKSAGNEGTDGVTKPGEMYNGLTVAAMDMRYDPYGPNRSNDVWANYSSTGKADGRKKPDVIAPGHYINTTRRDYETHDDFGTSTTSVNADNNSPISFKGTSTSSNKF